MCSKLLGQGSSFTSMDILFNSFQQVPKHSVEQCDGKGNSPSAFKNREGGFKGRKREEHEQGNRDC